MKHDDERIIDLQKIKTSRQRKKRMLRILLLIAALLILLAIGWFILAQILEILAPGDFWSNFA